MSCCHLSVFMEDFNDYWGQHFTTPPTLQQLARAKRDWKSGNTGWEGVQIAKQLAEDAATKAAGVPLVNIGGNNYAHAGSELAKRFGRGPTP